MKKLLPYFAITLAFGLFLILRHPQVFSYKFDQNLIADYLRSQDIEDPEGKIKDRITLSDSDLYIASGYMYATGEDPTGYDFQVPALIKYLFGFSIVLFGNPFFVQIVFGLLLLFFTFFLGLKLFKNQTVALIGTGLLLIDPVFGRMMDGALLDLGQAVFALSYTILMLFYPERYILQGVVLGLFATSKFWSTAVIFVFLTLTYKILIRKEKINYKKLILSFLVSFVVCCLVYIKSFINLHGNFNFLYYQARVLKFMLAHNSAGKLGGPIILFVTGYFAPWWQEGIKRASEWSFLWPAGLLTSLYLAIRTKMKDIKFFFYFVPFAFLLLISTQVPFPRYFLIILPFLYLTLAKGVVLFLRKLV